jgi:4-amino-4-deoxy-L-arabinose transferase-like glycosyltransferase
MILIAIVLVLTASIFATSLLRPPSKPAVLLSIYLFCYADIVLSSYIANTAWLLNQPLVMLGLHLIVTVVAILLWWRSGKPSLLGPFENWREELDRKRIFASLRKRPDLFLLSLGVFSAYLLAAILIVVVPPNNNDSLSTHLSRVGYWLQHGSFFPWPTAQDKQLFYPVNAQLQMFWSVLYTRSDKLVGFVQWMAALVAGIGVFGLARCLGWKRAPSAYAGLVFLTFPMILLQSTTTQNDVVSTALFVPAVYFLILGLQDSKRSMLLVSAMSLGLGLGTKQTYYFLLPGLAVLALLLLLKFGKRALSHLLYWGIACLLSFTIFSAYMNVINWRYLGNPLGPPETVQESIGGKTFDKGLEHLIYNVPRLLYQSLDTAGLPNPIDGYSHKVKARIARGFFDAIGFPIESEKYTTAYNGFSLEEKNENQEDYAWYGPLSVLLVFPAMLYQFIKGLGKREWIRVGIVLSAVIFLFCDAWLRPAWDHYQGRYFAPVVAINAALVAGWFAGQGHRYFLRWATVFLALTIAAVTVLYNPAKPILGKATNRVDIWTADRLTLMTLQGRRYKDMINMTDQSVPPDAVLGLYNPGYMLDYPLFGARFTRRLVPIYPFDEIDDPDWLNTNGITYVLVQRGYGQDLNLPDGTTRIAQIQGWRLYRFDPGS